MTTQALIDALGYQFGEETKGYPLHVRMAVEIATLSYEKCINYEEASYNRAEADFDARGAMFGNNAALEAERLLRWQEYDDRCQELNHEFRARLDAIYRVAALQ